jgi:hypothetical protein
VVDEKVRQPTARETAGSAVLDDAHLGDIRGAFGTLRQQDHGRPRSWRARLLAFAAIVGPGLIVMVGDTDAGGVSTYAQAGQNNGTSRLRTLLLLILLAQGAEGATDVAEMGVVEHGGARGFPRRRLANLLVDHVGPPRAAPSRSG